MKYAKPMMFPLILLLVGPAVAEQRYDLSDLEPQVGTTTESSSEMKGEDGTLKFVIDGEVLAQGTMDTLTSKTERKTVTKVEDGVITEYTTLMTASKDTNVTTFAGETTKEDEPSPLLNKEVTWKLVDGEYVPELPNATEEQLDELDPEPLLEHDVYPAEPIEVGHSWELSREAIADYIDEPLNDDFKAKGGFEFLAVEDYRGEPCAKLKIKMTISAKMQEDDLDEGMDSGRLSMTFEGIIYRSLKDRLDVGGKIEGQAKAEFEGSDPQGGAFTVIYEGELKMTGGDKLIRR